ncbi:MAG: amidophosphoribosyltransferase [Moorellales bacterium]
MPLFEDKPREECGLFGIYAPGQEVARLTFYGLFALQHRGQESAGLAVADGREVHLYKNLGLVTEVFSDELLAHYRGHAAVGHVRYSTTGSPTLVNAQPLVFRYLHGTVALAHNGNLTNALALRQMLAATGSIFQSTTDSEIIVNLLARYGQSPLEEALMKCLIDLKGAYSLLLMTEDRLIGLRDPHGIRPLCLGEIAGGYVLASESCALDTVGARLVRELDPGEIVIIDAKGLRSIKSLAAPEPAFCIFEFVYFARPDSILCGRTVNVVRWEMGRQLAREAAVEADIVLGVPDSGTAAALGYAEASGIPFQQALIKNRYVGRTFIQPSQSLRDLGVRLKLNPLPQVLAGKRVVLVDDSIVRGTTSRAIVQMLREAGAREVHFRVSSPPVLYPCYYGIDTSSQGELIAATYGVEEVRRYIGADTLHYLSLEGLLSAVGGEKRGFCTACFSGCYPTPVPPAEDGVKDVLERALGSRQV